ncbi:hypothetical protein BOTCAL_0066g00030 [Botryotinia calthae]|uniref:Uncharacterized protein n=1 Tax=Botryotinia calthae TaxID=38488 RepID=A0A4Y8D9B8_9HELO|nr:hypothetical protein BOTCAL_0066g00030 [Botryotinia calthae]
MARCKCASGGARKSISRRKRLRSMINYPAPLLCNIVIQYPNQAEWKKDFILIITAILGTHLLPTQALQEGIYTQKEAALSTKNAELHTGDFSASTAPV